MNATLPGRPTWIEIDGGAIANYEYGLVRILDSNFTGNNALAEGRDGGAIYNETPDLALSDEKGARSLVSGRARDRASIQAAATNNTLFIDGSTFNNNTAYEGGAIRSRDLLQLSNSTFTGNSAINAACDGGGALRLAGTAQITNVTIYNNYDRSGHASGIRISSPTGNYNIYNSIMAGGHGDACSTAGGVFAGG